MHDKNTQTSLRTILQCTAAAGYEDALLKLWLVKQVSMIIVVGFVVTDLLS